MGEHWVKQAIIKALLGYSGIPIQHDSTASVNCLNLDIFEFGSILRKNSQVPAALETSLSDVDLGDGLHVKMPKPQGPQGWMPKSLAETVVAPQSSPKEGYVKASLACVVDGGMGQENDGKCMKVVLFRVVLQHLVLLLRLTLGQFERRVSESLHDTRFSTSMALKPGRSVSVAVRWPADNRQHCATVHQLPDEYPGP